MPMVGRRDRDHVDVFALEHAPQVAVALHVHAALFELLLLLGKHRDIDIAKAHDARDLQLGEAADVVLAAAAAANHPNADVLGRTRDLRSRASGKAERHGPRGGSGKKTTTIDLLHTIVSF